MFARLKRSILFLIQLFVCAAVGAQTTISSLDEITNPQGNYKLSSDFTTSGTAFDGNSEIGTSSNPFKGTIDGQLVIITGTWDKPLFDYIEDATIKNVIIKSVSISISADNTNVGAIASNAKGESRIYNCGILSGSVSGTKYVGGLVGQLHNTGTKNKGSHVVNCFSYADVSGGTDVAGIVGHNDFASTNSDLRTMVMNCMFYGDITSGTNISPVYGGTNIDNQKKLNTYNYYRYESNYSKNGQITTDKYNCALAVEDKHLTHFEYYRLLLNSNKKLAAWYASTSSTTVNHTDMAKWVLETADRTNNNPYPYPILKPQGKYPSIINFDDAHAPTLTLVNGKPSEADRNKGGKMGTLTVNIEDHTSGNGSRTGTFISTTSKTLPITDKDFDRFNYNYYKVRLPYFNEVGEGNYTDGKVVTGWIITGMTGATTTQATSGTELIVNNGVITTPYNFADRTCTKLEDGSYRVFSQGAYFDVPVGVTAITIQPYWANAAFLADSNLDISYDNKFGTRTTVAKTVYTNGQTYDIDGVSGLTVYTSFSNAIGGISDKGTTVYDNAVVLVGNFHQGGIPYADKNVPFTVMSADFDEDNEPDFSFIYHHTDRKEISPIRFDFINVPGTAMAQKPNTSTMMCNAGIFKPYGWFELTNTALMRFGQFEYSFNDKALSPTIFLGGEIEQIVSNNSGSGTAFTNKTSYFLLGSNVWFKEFNNGTHSDKTHQTPHRPISVAGGRFEKFYLSGIYQPKVDAMTDNAECYIDGGSFGEVAGAGQEQIKGDVYWLIDYADIDNFYGGGINAAKPITGNIDITIRNSWVDVFCGGPKFGDMGSGKTVKTLATDCVFRRFFGAGYGGNSYNRVIAATAENNQPWASWDDNYTNNSGKYSSGNNGIPTSFEYEYFIGSKGTIWGRFYVNYASFSKATVHNVTSELTGCEITGDFYGGGCLGVVDGTATSILDGCSVQGSVFGGGYSATIPNIDVMTGGFVTIPGYNSSAGIFTPAEFPGSQSYEWETHAVSNGNSALGTGTIYTTEDLTNLGVVSNVNLTITGNTYVKGDIHTYDEEGDIDDSQTVTGGGVFGGGDASSIGNNTLVTIENAAQSNQKDILKVFGGGNQAGVTGNTTVTLTSGLVSNAIYGGCNANGNIGGATNILLNGGSVGSQSLSAEIFGGGLGSLTTTSGNTNVTLNGTTVYGDIYGGSAFGTVNDDANDYTTVNILSGTINGNIYGGGLGENGDENVTKGQVNGTVVVNIGATDGQQTPTYSGSANIIGSVYGCNNTNGSPKNDVTVNVYSTGHDAKNLVSYSGSDASYAINQVFGGGNKADYSPVSGKKATVHVYGCDNTIGRVFGGGNAAAALQVATVIEGGRFYQIFGGGNGEVTAANIGAGGASLTVSGGIITQLFGGSNSQGTINGPLSVNISNSGCDEEIDEFFGGGNLADITGNITTSIQCSDPPVRINNLYGGSNLANITGDVTLNVYGGEFINVFGGSKGRLADSSDPNNQIEAKAANITGAVTLNLYGGSMTRAFGGSNINGNVTGKITVNMDDSGGCNLDVDNVYGGGQDASYTPTTKGAYPEVNIINGTVNQNVYGGGKGVTAVVNSNPVVTIGDNDESHHVTVSNKVFGGGDEASVIGNTSVTIISGNVNGGVYGGCNNLGSVGDVLISLNGGSVGATGSGNSADVYGGGYGSATTTTGNIGVSLHGTTVYGNIYGGSALGSVNTNTENTAIVTLSTATLYGSVFGGGKGDNSNTAVSNGNTVVNINIANTNLTGIYGGANIRGNIKGATAVNIKADVGASGNSLDIFGGGYGANTNTEGNVTVTIGDVEGNYTPTIYGDIYGGSALGNVNNESTDITTVNFLNGTLHGNLYGGGLGRKATDAVGTEGQEGYQPAVTAIPALVNGQVIVNVSNSTQTAGQCKIDLRDATIYGCNNTNGSPQDNVTVNIYKTAYNYSDYTTGDNYTAEDGAHPYYAIDQVFGGGNQADYLPQNGLASSEKKAVVHIYGCDNTIRRVFGGGNAAAVTGIQTIIEGGRFDYVFGGGNGEVTAANIGLGGTDLKIHGGHINMLFGGSNAQGTITGQMGVLIDAVGACGSDMYIAEFFCGNNEADVTTDINATIGCGTHFGDVYGGCNLADITGNVTLTIEGGIMNNVYGGSKGRLADEANSIAAKAANITGNVTLNIYGGKILQNAFGGSNINGNIGGAITVNLDWSQASTNCNTDLYVGNIYGASNLATYTPSTVGSYPAVYIKNGSVSGNVYGGGKGTTAVVTSNPNVTIGDATAEFVAVVTGDVYGGGDAAAVIGTPVVHVINKASTSIGNVYGGGNAADVSATSVTIDGGTITGDVYGGGHGDRASLNDEQDQSHSDQTANVSGNVSVQVTGGTINRVFAGANTNGSIGGNASVNIEKGANSGEMHITELYGGGNMAPGNAGSITIGCTGGSTEGIGDVYGGANQADIGNNINLNITGGSIQNVFGGNNTSGTISGTIAVTVNWDTQDPCDYNYLGSVFGGGNLASYSGTPLVTITNGTVHNVYGGGNQADVAGATVNLNGGSVLNGLYGGCNTSGIVTGDIAVNINGGTVGTDANNTANIHGGGFGENTGTSGNVEVTIGSAVGAQTYPTIYGDVYGGSAMGEVNGTQLNESLHTYVTLYAGTINGSLYGGALGAEGISANVYAPVTVTVNGGTVTGGVYGCNNVNGAPQGAVTVHINGTDQLATDYAIAKVFGGGNKAAYSGTPLVRIHYSLSGEQNPNPNKIEYIYGGGNQATVEGTDVIVYGGSQIGYVFGGGYGADVTTDGTDVKIYGGTIGKVFGGNDQSGSVTGDISVLVNKQAEQGHEACLMKIDEVYGGGNLAASQAGNLTISSTGGDEEYISYVYGGANNAYVHGDITLNITSGRITEAIFGGNNTGNTVDGDVTVNVNWNNSNGANDRKYLKDVFGGGNQASVSGNTTVKLINGIISNDVYGGGKQAPVNGSTIVSIEGGTVTNDVYGGGMQGDVAGDVTVNISSASYNGNANVVTINGSVYGGGALAHTNTANRSVNAQHEEVINLDESSKKTIVNLHPGATIGHDVYGGGRGQQPTDSDPGEAIVYGNVTVYQHGSILTAEYSNGLATRGRIFGGNNVNGSPRGHILVYVSKTTGTTGQMRSSETDRMSATAIHTYELAAVYGGGNQAEYLPYDVDNEYAEVHIDGCDDVSIHSVYGGGNAASTPATLVTLSGAYEIEYVFGGGNGAGSDNPGANVGYHYYDHEGAHGGLSDEDVAWRNDPENKLLYGKGTATTNVYGGRIHYIYGGSNTKGNVRKASVARLEELSSCPLNIDEIYGGGRAAYMDGSASLELGCISGLDAIYGGSERADIGKDIELTITSGKFKKVFGGNNVSGRIFGSIKVNIEQTGCLPIEIGELYGGGNLADYSVYGYDGDDLYYEPQPNTTAYDDPEINIKSFKSIETVYGGGYKAEMVGNPHININVVKGWTNGEYKGKGEGVQDDYAEYKNTPKNMDSMGEIGDVFGGGNEADVYGQTYINIGTDESIKIHSVPQYVYEIIKDNRTPDNNPSDITDPGYETDKETETKDLTIKVGGAIINGNVYGGGNKADVTEGSNITVGH